MPFKRVTKMESRKEFIELALKKEISLSELCRREGISRPTAYKWLQRYSEDPVSGLLDRSSTPRKTQDEVEVSLLAQREKHSKWGARKLRQSLMNEGKHDGLLPSVSTCHNILKRNDKIAPDSPSSSGPFKRFEMEHPNDLWQMDHKGDVACGAGRCFPLTILDDHSRFNIELQAHGNQLTDTVKTALIQRFRLFGMPKAILMDNGKPWGDSNGSLWTSFDVWLFRLGVRPMHSRPLHPQTLGKEERFHRTLKAELLQGLQVNTLEEYQKHFNKWREIYNHERPHEALGMQVPAKVYVPSQRSYPEQLPPIEYAPDVIVRRVKSTGFFYFKGHQIGLSKSFTDFPIGLRPSLDENLLNVLFSRFHLADLDLTTMKIIRKEGAKLSKIM